MNIKTMTTEEIMNIGNNRKVVWDYYVSDLKGFDGYSRLYINKETGEISEVYSADQTVWPKNDDVVKICGTSTMRDVESNEHDLETIEAWYADWCDEYFEEALIDAIDNI